MKKKIVILAVLCMSVWAFAACGAKKEEVEIIPTNAPTETPDANPGETPEPTFSFGGLRSMTIALIAGAAIVIVAAVVIICMKKKED